MRKIHLWISLIVGIGVWGAYFAHLVQGLRAGQTGGLLWWFLGALVVTVAAETLATGAVAWLFRRRSRMLDDGPTLQAALKASHMALMLLIVMILVLAMVVIAELSRAGLTLALLPRR